MAGKKKRGTKKHGAAPRVETDHEKANARRLRDGQRRMELNLENWRRGGWRWRVWLLGRRPDNVALFWTTIRHGGVVTELVRMNLSSRRMPLHLSVFADDLRWKDWRGRHGVHTTVAQNRRLHANRRWRRRTLPHRRAAGGDQPNRRDCAYARRRRIRYLSCRHSSADQFLVAGS